jgi:tripartite ATP-independent transporter DctM subunit
MNLVLFVLVGGSLLLAAALPIAAVIAAISVGLNFVTPVPVLNTLAITAWNQSQSYLLVSVPLYILFGEIMVRSGIASAMYGAVTPWLNRLPGKLMQTNIATSAIFAATSGSSVATAATISAVAIPEIGRGHYNERLFLGSIAAGGTLGILIPPSINMIVYASLTNTSIPQLYLAGVVPGLILMVAFMVTTAVACLARPDWDGDAVNTSWRSRFTSLPALLPPLIIFLVVIGSVYAGWATPTEAAGLGVVASMVLALLRRRLTLAVLNESLLATMRTTAMLLLILVCANFLNFVLGFLGFSTAVESWMLGLDVSPLAIITGIVVLYLLLGCVLDGLSMTVLTVPVLAPIVAKLGFDLIWFGILVVLVTETGLITPPVGMNCYVVQGMRGRGSIVDVFIGVAPYVVALLAVIALIVLAPGIVLWFSSLL